ncbi:MAG TPA: hypothetical protein VMM93_04860, partial [Vicinamibacterales bacterium]|nr:hypothetical protein [Vicinamibacterales bacterium]
MTWLPRRLVAMCVGAALVVAGAGFAWEFIHFGTSVEASAARLEREVKRRFANQTRRVEALARSVATEGPRVLAAQASSDDVPALFSRLLDLASPVGLAGTSATIYTATAGGFRVLAWSDGPAEDLTPDRLQGPRALFVAPGASGLRLVAVHPIEVDGTRRAVAAAEGVLAAPLPQAITRSPGACLGRLETSYGPVTAVGPCGGAGVSPPGADGFVIEDDAGAVLLEVRFDPQQLTAQRSGFRRRLTAVAAAPLVVLLLMSSGPLLTQRNRSQSVLAWVQWTAVTASVLLAAALAAAGLAFLAGLDALVPAVTGLTAVAMAALVAGGWWWRPVRRRPPTLSRVRFVLEHAMGGLVVAGALVGSSRLVQGRISSESIAVWQFPLFPFDGTAVIRLLGIILTQIAVCWVVAVVLSVLADRWRLGHRGAWAVLWAVLLWTVPTALVVSTRLDASWAVAGPWLGAAGALAAFGA